MAALSLVPSIKHRTPSIKTDGAGGGWTNEATGQGGPLDRHTSTRFVTPAPLTPDEVDALMMHSGIARKIVWRKVDDAMRAGFALVGGPLDADPRLAVECVRWARRRGVHAAAKLAKALARATGGAVVLPVLSGGGALEEPLDRASIRGVARFVVRDRFEARPLGTVSLDPLSPWYGQAEHWQIQGRTRTHRVHASRLIRFDGEPISDRARESREGWGASVLDLLYSRLRNYDTVGDAAAEAVTLLTQGVWSLPGYAEAIAAGNAEKIAARFRAMRAGLGTLGDIVIDAAGGESYQVHGRSFAGLADIREIVESALVAASPYPRIVLLGETTPGLSGGASGELKSYYNDVEACQVDELEDPILDMLGLVLADPRSPLGGLVPPDLALRWASLWTSTPDELAATRLKAAQRRRLDAEVVDRVELRTDPDLVDIYDLADESVMPEPPAVELDAAPVEPDLPMDGEPLVEISAAARQLGMRSSAPLRRLVESGALRSWRAGGGRRRVRWSDVLSLTGS